MDLTIEHLDLAVPKVDRKVTKLVQLKHNCYCSSQFKHNIHNDNPHLNTITYILISLSLNLEKQVKNLTEYSYQMKENIILKNNILKELFLI